MLLLEQGRLFWLHWGRGNINDVIIGVKVHAPTCVAIQRVLFRIIGLIDPDSSGLRPYTVMTSQIKVLHLVLTFASCCNLNTRSESEEICCQGDFWKICPAEVLKLVHMSEFILGPYPLK